MAFPLKAARACLFALCGWLAAGSVSAGAETNTVIEELTFEVSPERVADFLRHDADIWTALLAGQEGFLGKRVWTSPEHPGRVRLVIEWRSRAAWHAVPPEQLSQTDRRFKKAMGGDRAYRMISSRAFDALTIPPSVGGGLGSYDLTSYAEEWLSEPQSIVVPHDRVFHKEKKYRAVPLRRVLQLAFDLESLEAGGVRLAFECRDGYQATMLLSEALAADGWVAVADLEAGPGRTWTENPETGGKPSLAPYYVVWRVEAGAAAKLPWPYAVERLRLVKDGAFYKAAYPHGSPEAAGGFEAFRKHCATCHSVNGAGGLLGGELNTPVSVTQYWKPEHLRAYIRNPSAYQAGSRMPAMKHVPEAELDALLAYLRVMADTAPPESKAAGEDAHTPPVE